MAELCEHAAQVLCKVPSMQRAQLQIAAAGNHNKGRQKWCGTDVKAVEAEGPCACKLPVVHGLTLLVFLMLRGRFLFVDPMRWA